MRPSKRFSVICAPLGPSGGPFLSRLAVAPGAGILYECEFKQCAGAQQLEIFTCWFSNGRLTTSAPGSRLASAWRTQQGWWMQGNAQGPITQQERVPMFTRLLSRLLIVCMIGLPFQVHAGLIGTDQVVSAAQAAAARST